MNQLPSERIQEIEDTLDINWSDDCESNTHDKTLRAILVYLDEEYEKKNPPPYNVGGGGGTFYGNTVPPLEERKARCGGEITIKLVEDENSNRNRKAQ